VQAVGFYDVHRNLGDDTTYAQHRKNIRDEDRWVPKAEVDYSNTKVTRQTVVLTSIHTIHIGPRYERLNSMVLLRQAGLCVSSRLPVGYTTR
jgi:hypothetical protein